MPRSDKIGVLTFHRCINYGSYWQARCVVEGLRQRDYPVVLLDHHSPRVSRAELRCALQPALPWRSLPEDLPRYAAKARKFFQAFDRFPLSAPFALEEPSDAEPCDLVVVGSDEVWNFQHPWYAACPVFFGEGLKAGRLVSYAASFGCHDASAAVPEPWAERLKRFAAIGVRDDNSQRLVRNAIGRDPALVLDPCLQFDFVCRRAPSERAGDHVVIYGHTFPDWFIAAVRRWATERGLRLLSLGYRNHWADKQWLTAGPEDFAQAMADARMVVTNFFHGCVFALVNGKPFACAHSAYRSHKVTGLARAVGAEGRLIYEDAPEERLALALDEPLGSETPGRIAALRRRSAAYLDHALA